MLPTEIKKGRTEARRGVNMYKDKSQEIYDKLWVDDILNKVRNGATIKDIEAYMSSSGDFSPELRADILEKARNIIFDREKAAQTKT